MTVRDLIEQLKLREPNERVSADLIFGASNEIHDALDDFIDAGSGLAYEQYNT